MNANGLQFKTAGFAVALQKADGGAGADWLIGGYASTFGGPPDLVGDVIAPGAYTASLLERPNVPVLWQHQEDKPIGRTTFLVQDSYGLLFQAKLAPTSLGRDARILTQEGVIDSLSIGYSADYVRGELPGEKRRLTSIALFEISLVTWPANPKAKLTASGPAKQMLLDRLLIARVDHEGKNGLPLMFQPQATRVKYIQAQERELERLGNGGKTDRELLYDIAYELQQLQRLEAKR